MGSKAGRQVRAHQGIEEHDASRFCPGSVRGESSEANLKAPDAVIKDLMSKVQRDLYKGKPFDLWAAQQKMVKKALLHPAACLHKQGIELSAERYQAILEGIITTVAAKGDLQKVTYMSRYFYYCVQQHMIHQGDRYYTEGKAVRNRVHLTMSALEKAVAGADSTVPVLAEADKLLQIGKRKGKVKPVSVPKEPDLFQ